MVGCTYGNNTCDVTFQLNYQIGNHPVELLESWREVYDGQATSIDIDLSPLAGQKVKWILTVINNGSSTGDWGFWLDPHIEQAGENKQDR
jgi:hypothetical protein